MARQLSAKAILPDQISLEHCDWYSDDAPAGHNTGALKLPRGNTSERPTTATGGRENVELIATTSQPNTLSSDGGFLQNDPWIWAWDGNYNRNMLTATTVASGNALPGFTLLRGSTYRFRNGTVGHNLWLRSAEKTSSGQANNIFALGASDGVTNNGAIRADSSAASTTTTWEIPSNYSGTQVFIQHNQTGMVNTIPIADPPDETLGYIRLNTDIGHDESTQTGLELYTGTGWKTIPFADNAGGTKAHPVGTLLTDDNGLLTGSVASTDDAGALTGSGSGALTCSGSGALTGSGSAAFTDSGFFTGSGALGAGGVSGFTGSLTGSGFGASCLGFGGVAGLAMLACDSFFVTAAGWCSSSTCFFSSFFAGAGLLATGAVAAATF